MMRPAGFVPYDEMPQGNLSIIKLRTHVYKIAYRSEDLIQQQHSCLQNTSTLNSYNVGSILRCMNSSEVN